MPKYVRERAVLQSGVKPRIIACFVLYWFLEYYNVQNRVL